LLPPLCILLQHSPVCLVFRLRLLSTVRLSLLAFGSSSSLPLLFLCQQVLDVLLEISSFLLFLEDFHAEEGFHDFSDGVLLLIIIFELFAHEVQHQQNDSGDESPDVDGWLLVGLCPGYVGIHFLVVDTNLISLETDDGVGDFLNLYFFWTIGPCSLIIG
jgi:hypothetical protein